MRRFDTGLHPGLRILLVAAAVVLLALALSGVFWALSGGGAAQVSRPAQAQEEGDESATTEVPEGEAVAEVAAEVGPSTVQVNVTGVRQTPFGEQQGEGIGSGVIYRQDGYVVTNAHVVEGASEVEIAFADGSTSSGEVVGDDPATDLAVIRTDRRDLPAATFGDSSALVPGQLAVAIGSPSGFQSTVTSGVVSGVGREIPAEYTGGSQESALVDLIQTDAPISPGNSGGALADRGGEVIGINVAYLPSETGAVSIGFAIPASTAISVADQLIETGEATQPYLGVQLSDLSAETAGRFDTQRAESGALIAEVTPGGPASGTDLRAGDVVTAIDGEPVRDSGDLLGALRGRKPGDTVELTVARGEEGLSIEVRLGEREG